MTSAYYVGMQPATDIETKLSEKAFPSVEHAKQDATKVNTLKRRILSLCQQEYADSLNKVIVSSVGFSLVLL